MKTTVQRWGNSLALRIPKAFAVQARMKRGSAVDLTLEKGRLVVTPAEGDGPSLSRLLSKVTARNIHRETHWGRAEGNEAW